MLLSPLFCLIFNQNQLITYFVLWITAILSPVSPVPQSEWGHGKPLFMRCPQCPQCPQCPHAKKRERKQNRCMVFKMCPQFDRLRPPFAWCLCLHGHGFLCHVWFFAGSSPGGCTPGVIRASMFGQIQGFFSWFALVWFALGRA